MKKEKQIKEKKTKKPRTKIKTIIKNWFAVIGAKRDKDKYISRLEKENIRLKGNIKLFERQEKRTASEFLKPIRDILSNVDFNDESRKDLCYIKTQLESFLFSKGYLVYKPDLPDYNRKEVIVSDIVKCDDKEKNGLPESVVLLGIKNKDGMVVLPSEIRIYKFEEKKNE
ncbi:MAG: hypothetical protein H6687_00825 [Bacillales bacterium]|nr:hypothetical protein [Bacillales bacterium]